MMLRLAFIGAGQMARHHLDACGGISQQVSVVGVYDRAADRARQLAGAAGAKAFTSVAALLGESHPDIVHVCTPPVAHFEAAHAALEAGAHVYVEKPFARTAGDARTLLDLAASRKLLVCAGHQLLRDPAFERLIASAPALGDLVQVDSHFAFKPASVPARGSAAMLARELVDILPHPLYALIAVLERYGDPAEPISLTWAHSTPTTVQAIVSRGHITGRLSVSVVARPVASSLTLIGTHGASTCDFVRSTVIGTGNGGVEPLEKAFNPIVEGAQLISRTSRSLAGRLWRGGSYPGLCESIAAFHKAVATGGPAPLSPSHLLTVTTVFERLASRVEAAAYPPAVSRRRSSQQAATPQIADSASGSSAQELYVVTGARGFLGSAIAAALPRVRGIGRNGWHGEGTYDWVASDLSEGLRPETLAGAAVVIHAAAATAGGVQEHQRNSLDATRHLLQAMHQAGVRRLVLVSSLSVLTPPRTPWERQHERTPRCAHPERLGAYTWGKTKQEEIVELEAAALGIDTIVIRPGALIDYADPVLPGLVGRRLFGRWHLGLGRPGLPIAVCDVGACGRVIAWCARHFDQSPKIVNLLDPATTTRGDLIGRFRAAGWNGRMCWVPIPALAAAISSARTALALLTTRRLPERLDAWALLRPRRFRLEIADALLTAANRDAGTE